MIRLKAKDIKWPKVIYRSGKRILKLEKADFVWLGDRLVIISDLSGELIQGYFMDTQEKIEFKISDVEPAGVAIINGEIIALGG